MIKIKTKKEVQTMKEGAQMLAKIMREVERKIEPGISTKELNMAAESHIFKCGAKPSFLNYHGFPATLCVSINDEIVHGVPSQRKIKEGDIVSLDLGLFYKGFHSDMAKTIAVGEVDFETSRLIKVTKKSLKIGIRKMKPGNKIGAIGNTIQRYVEDQGFNVVRELCGHGIGRDLHEDPEVLNYGKGRGGEVMKEGMVLCLEPMVTVGNWAIKTGEDGFTLKTADGSLSCHFEHEVLVTRTGSQVLTELR